MSVWRSCPESWLGHRGPVLFLDRDGVVIADRDYLGDPREVQVLPGVAATMLAAREAGFAVVGVSNQSGLGRGFFTPADFTAVMERLDELLARQGAEFDGFYYCPHAPKEDCDCRKPKGGLLEEAARLVTKERGNAYGPPEQDFQRTAKMWTGLFQDLLKDGMEFKPEHVALAMILLKASRAMWSEKRDNWVDIPGYAACGHRIQFGSW
jgi:histidinol-phosphate phosphatase family protein